MHALPRTYPRETCISVLDIVKCLAAGPLVWVPAMAVSVFVGYIGFALVVALTAEGERGKRAAELVRDLLAVLKRGSR